MRASIVMLLSLLYGSHGAADDLYTNVRWAIFHEGCNVFDVRSEPGDDALAPAAERRACYLAVQRHNTEASQVIANATDDALDEVATRAAADIPKAFNLREHLLWVMDHEGQRGAFRRLVRDGQFPTVRFVYRRLQSHNDNARNLLAAVSNAQLRDLVLEIDRALPPDPSRNPLTGRVDDVTVSLPAAALDDTGLTRLQRMALERSRPETWTTKRAPVGGHLDTVVQKLYGTQSETFTKELAELVRQVSQLPGPFVSPGQQLRAPDLPVRPLFPKVGVAQVFDTNTGRVTTRELATGEFLSFDAALSASSFAITGNPADIDVVLRSLSPGVIEKAYTGPTYETVTLIPQQANVTAGPCGTPPPGAAGAIPAADTGGLYFVVDFFKKTDKEPCPHGARVVEVLAQQFERAGKPELVSRIVPIEADYYRNKAELNKYLDEYVARADPADSGSIDGSVKYHKKRDPKKEKIGPFEVPIIYVQAVYDHILNNPRAYVASASFFTAGTEHSLFPPSFKSNRRVLMLAAVTDDPGNVEDYQLEPIRTFYTMRRDAGVLLVGALLKDSKAFGMTSQKGDGVSCVGDGEGWGDNKTCIKPGERGTSFATPAVGAALFVSQLASACTPTATEWRDRALRTVKIVPEIAGRYVAPGVPQTQWMGVTTPAMIVNANDRASGIATPSGTITYSTSDGTSTATTQFGRSGSRVSAVQRAGAKWYLYFEDAARWQEVVVTAIDLTYTTPTGDRRVTKSDFDNQIKGVIIL